MVKYHSSEVPNIAVFFRKKKRKEKVTTCRFYFSMVFLCKHLNIVRHWWLMKFLTSMLKIKESSSKITVHCKKSKIATNLSHSWVSTLYVHCTFTWIMQYSWNVFAALHHISWYVCGVHVDILKAEPPNAPRMSDCATVAAPNVG